MVHSAHLGKISNTSYQMKNSPRDFGGNHGNCLLNWIIVTLSESSLFLQLSDAPKLDKFLNVVLLYLGTKSFPCAAETCPQIRMKADERLGCFSKPTFLLCRNPQPLLLSTRSRHLLCQRGHVTLSTGHSLAEENRCGPPTVLEQIKVGDAITAAHISRASPTLFLWLTRYHLPDSFKLLRLLVQEDQKTVGPRQRLDTLALQLMT